MAKKSFGLGRGLDALLPTETAAESGVSQISLGDIDPNAEQPRHLFDEEALAQLAQSIRDQGVLQPLLVSPQPGGRYRIIAGERRWRASRMAGLDTVPCIVRDMDEIRQMEVALIENLQREDLNPMEEAAGIRALMRQCGYTQEAVAERLCKSRPAVANLLQYGVEGSDYVRVEGTQAVITREGTPNADGNGYSAPFVQYGKVSDRLLMAPLTDDIYAVAEALENAAVKSACFGYTFDASEWGTEAAAIGSVLQEKLPMLNAGTVADVDKAVDDLVAALRDAGMYDVIADNQAQLNAYLGK